MKVATWGFAGLILGGVYVLVVGVLSFQAMGQHDGVVFDLSNSVVELTTPRQPVVPMLAVAAVSVLVMYALVGARHRARSDRLAMAAGFSVAVLALVVTALSAPTLRIVEPGVPVGEVVAWRGWIDEGGISPAVHVLLLFALGSPWLFSGSRRARVPAQGHEAAIIELDGHDGHDG